MKLRLRSVGAESLISEQAHGRLYLHGMGGYVPNSEGSSYGEDIRQLISMLIERGRSECS